MLYCYIKFSDTSNIAMNDTHPKKNYFILCADKVFFFAFRLYDSDSFICDKEKT